MPSSNKLKFAFSKEQANAAFATDSIKNYLTGIGSESDPTTYARPTLDGRLSTAELEYLFLENDLAKRIVCEIVEDSFRAGLPTLEYHESGEPVKLDFDIEQDASDLFTEAAVDARLYGGSHIMLIVDDGKRLSEPLNWEELPEFQNAFVVNRSEAQPIEWGTEASDPRFMEPILYMVHPSSSGGPTQYYPRVHHTRLLSFRGARLPRKLRRRNQDYDDSVLQQVWHAISNFYQSEKSIVNIINRFETATISIAGLSEIQSESDGEELVKERMKILQMSLSILNAALVDADAGETYERKFAIVNGLDGLWDRLALSVAKAAQMSKTQLFGESASGIRGDDEAGGKGWRKQVEEYQVMELLMNLVKYVSLVLGERLAPVRSDEGKVAWGHAESSKPVDKARIRQMESTRVVALLQEGVIDKKEARILLNGGTINWDQPPPEEPPAEVEEENENPVL